MFIYNLLSLLGHSSKCQGDGSLATHPGGWGLWYSNQKSLCSSPSSIPLNSGWGLGNVRVHCQRWTVGWIGSFFQLHKSDLVKTIPSSYIVSVQMYTQNIKWMRVLQSYFKFCCWSASPPKCVFSDRWVVVEHLCFLLYVIYLFNDIPFLHCRCSNI